MSRIVDPACRVRSRSPGGGTGSRHVGAVGGVMVGLRQFLAPRIVASVAVVLVLDIAKLAKQLADAGVLAGRR